MNATTATERVGSAPRRAAAAATAGRVVDGQAAARAAVALGAACPVLGLGLGAGGYFPTAWGWAALWCGWLVLLALVLRADIALDRRSAAGLAAVAGLVGWIALSIRWARDVPGAVLEAERAVVYLLGFAAVVLGVGRERVGSLAGGLLGGVTAVCIVALSNRLVPDGGEELGAISLNRLSDPVGYWNALGLLAAVGLILALVLAGRATGAAWRAVSGAAVPVLAATLYFTYSRGGWIALAVGLVVVVAADPRRLQLLPHIVAVGALAAIGVWIASQQDGLTRLTASHALIESEGRRMIVVLAVLTVAAAAITLAVGFAQRRAPALGRRARRTVEMGLLAAAVLATVSVIAAYGGPKRLADRAYDSFKGEDVATVDPENLNRRLFTLHGEGRVDLWRLAWRDHRAHALTGAGAGGFEEYYLQHRPTATQVRDAHNLYLETLDELGWIGAALLLAVLAIPLVAAARARRHPIAIAALGVLVAYLVEASVDWTWEVPLLTLIALACAAMLLVAAREERPAGQRGRGGVHARVAGVVAVVALVGLMLPGIVGHRAGAAAGRALERGDWNEARNDATTAIRWAPWWAWGHQARGNAEASLGRLGAAQADLREATRMDPGNWRVWFDLGNASRGGERLAAWRRAAELNPLAEDIRAVRIPLQRAERRR